MTLVELKNFITANIMPSEFLILVDKDNKFLAKQYIEALSKNAFGGVNRISSIYEPFQSSVSLLTVTEGCLNILRTDTFSERAENYAQFENTIVICEQVDKNILEAVKNFTIKLPKFEDWQIYDYTKTLCPALDENDLMWLIKATDGSIERVVNELDKVRLFDKQEQKQIFSNIRFDIQSDLNKFKLFDIVNALVEGNLVLLYNYIIYKNCEFFEPIVLANRALISLKNIILINQNPQLSAKDFGMSLDQYRAIKNKYRSINTTAVRQKIKFLTNIDLALKTSQLDLSKRDLLSYLVANLAYKIN